MVIGTTSDVQEMSLLLSLAGQAQFGLEEYENAHELFTKALKYTQQARKPKKKDVHDLQIWLARCLYATSDVKGNRVHLTSFISI
jgi:ribosomal protein L20